MILAAFGDVEGNLDALRRVLDDIENEGIQTTLCTGNVAVGPHPNEVVALLKLRQVFVVQGDRDRALARLVRKRKRLARELAPDALAQLEQVYRQCSSANLEWLANLPHLRTLKIDGDPVVLFHGAVSSATSRLHPEDPDEVYRRQREIVPAQVFVFGGDRSAALRHVDDALFVNPGPLADANSGTIGYAIISTETDAPTAEHRSID